MASGARDPCHLVVLATPSVMRSVHPLSRASNGKKRCNIYNIEASSTPCPPLADHTEETAHANQPEKSNASLSNGDFWSCIGRRRTEQLNIVSRSVLMKDTRFQHGIRNGENYKTEEKDRLIIQLWNGAQPKRICLLEQLCGSLHGHRIG